MITKFLHPSRNTLLGFLSFIISLRLLVTPSVLLIRGRITFTIIAFVCIFLGILGLKKFKQSNPTILTRIMCILGILLCINLGYVMWSIKFPKVTGTISEIRFYKPDERHDYICAIRVRPDDPVSHLVEGSIEGIFVVLTDRDTLIIKQTRGRLTRIVTEDQFEINQHIEIEYYSWVMISDPEQINAVIIRILDQ